MKNLLTAFALVPLLLSCAKPALPVPEAPKGRAATTVLPGGPKGSKITVVDDIAVNENFATANPKQRLDIYVMGDSMTAGEMSYGPGLEMINRTRNRVFRGWAMNVATPVHTELKGVLERLNEASYSVRMTNTAWSGAYVDKATKLDRSAANSMGNIKNFSDQVERLNKLPKKPNLILLAPFHNNLDFQFDLDNIATLKATHKEDYLQAIPTNIKQAYKHAISDIVKPYLASRAKVSIVLLGNMNLKAAFAGRKIAEQLHKANPKSFPFFDVAPTRFPSILQENEIIALSEKVTEAIKDVARFKNEALIKAGFGDEAEVVYSDAISAQQFNEPKYLHANDAFHPSALGQNKIAEAVEKDLQDRIHFLGVKPN